MCICRRTTIRYNIKRLVKERYMELPPNLKPGLKKEQGGALRVLYMDSCLKSRPLARTPPPNWNSYESCLEFNEKYGADIVNAYMKQDKANERWPFDRKKD